jgi:uncharacterized protein YhbP (UPF0306 family)
MSNSTRTSELHRRIEAFLAAHHVMSLATIGHEGPHAASLFYACDGFVLFWISDPASRHSRDVDAEPRVAATIAADFTSFAEICGLQIRGTARRVEQSEGARYFALLEARYTFLKHSAEGPKKMHDAYAQSSIYRLDPKRIVLIDNTKRFGHKETLELSSGCSCDTG